MFEDEKTFSRKTRKLALCAKEHCSQQVWSAWDPAVNPALLGPREPVEWQGVAGEGKRRVLKATLRSPVVILVCVGDPEMI